MVYIKYDNKKFYVLNQFQFKQSNTEITFNDIIIDFAMEILSNRRTNIMDIPYKFQEIEVYENDVLIFVGYVDTVKPSEIKYSEQTDRELAITLFSPLKLSTLRTVSINGTYQANIAIQKVLKPLLDDGFTIRMIDINDSQITLNSVMQSIESVMNEICSKKNIFWWINVKKEITVISIEKMFARTKKMIINNEKEKNGMYQIFPSIENTDYANVINFKNIRLFFSSNETFKIVDGEKRLKNGDEVNFNYPVVIDEETAIKLKKENDNSYANNLILEFDDNSLNVNIGYSDTDGYYNSANFTFDDDPGEEGNIVLMRDSFFRNLITGFKYNGTNETTLKSIVSDTALKNTSVRYENLEEIDKNKNIISKTGIIEKTIDINSKWMLFSEVLEYGKSLMIQNSNTINQIQLAFDEDPSLEIGDIIEVDLEKFYSIGNFAVTEINYSRTGNTSDWIIIAKETQMINNYLDIFRPLKQEENEESITSLTIVEHVTDEIREVVEEVIS